MTIKEFAALAGVSASTVSKIMNGKDASIRPETRDHVLRLAKEYHYNAASGGRSPDSRTLTLGIITSGKKRLDLTLSGLIDRASALEYSVLLKDSRGEPETERKNILMMLAKNVDALVWDPVPSSDIGDITGLIRQSKTRFLFLSSDHNRLYQLPQIGFDKMGYAACEALVKKGHTDIACLLYEGSRSAGLLRGYKRCLYDHSIICKDDLVFRDEDAMIRKIGNGKFTGLVVSHYSAALRIYSRVNDLHYAIPNDLSMISLNNDIVGIPEVHPLVSFIRVPFYEYGEYLAEYLIREIEKKQPLPPFDFPVSADSDASLGPPFPASVKRIVSVGSVNIDNYLNFNELPLSGTTAASSSLSVYPGGKCINQAIGAAILGHPVSVIGRVGDDADSDNIYKTIKDYSIDHQGLMRTEREKTGQAYIFVGKSGESMISLLPGANRAITPEDMKHNRRLFTKNGFCLLQTEIPMPALIEASCLAKEQDMTTVLKPSACDALPDALLDHIDMLIPNRDELYRLCHEGTGLEEKAAFYLKRGIRTVIVTLGADGCYVRTDHISEYIPAIGITSVDVSGAGDAFICCLVSYLIYGYDIVRAARIATYAAGISTTRQGTVPALVNRSTLESYITNMEPDLLRPS